MQMMTMNWIWPRIWETREQSKGFLEPSLSRTETYEVGDNRVQTGRNL